VCYKNKKSAFNHFYHYFCKEVAITVSGLSSGMFNQMEYQPVSKKTKNEKLNVQS
jgi:hypothetical protein